MNVELRRRMIEKAVAILDEGSTLLAVRIDEFFAGNTDEDSICVNAGADKPRLAEVRGLFTGIRERPDVQEVFLELMEVPDPDDELDDGVWPTASVAFIVTSAPLKDVEEWVEALDPRDVRESWCVPPGVKTPIAEGELRAGMRPVRVWLL